MTTNNKGDKDGNTGKNKKTTSSLSCAEPGEDRRNSIFDEAVMIDLINNIVCADCHLARYDSIAIEKDKDYWKLSVERLEETKAQGRLF